MAFTGAAENIQATKRSPKLLFFEGLRGIAAFVVVVWHLRLTFYATSSSDIRGHLAFLPNMAATPLVALAEGLYSGTFAVWLFWIMSAFVLSLQFFLHAGQTPPTRANRYLKDACLRRYPRLLLPVLASVAFAYAIQSFGLMHNMTLAHAFGEPYESGFLGRYYNHFPISWAQAFRSAVWESFFAYSDATTYNAVLWTMEKEFYGSLFLFAFLRLQSRRNSRFFVYPAIALIGYGYRLHWLNAFIAGIVLCDLFVNRDTLIAVRTASGWPAVQMIRRSPFAAFSFWSLILICVGLPNAQSVRYLLTGVAAVGLTLLSTPTQRVLCSGAPVFLGRISFGLYLIHLPVICSFSCWAYLATFASIGASAAALLVSIVTCVLSVALGYALYVIADRPALRLSRWLASLIVNAFAWPRRAVTRRFRAA